MRSAAILRLLAFVSGAAGEAALDVAVRRKGPSPEVRRVLTQPVCAAGSLAVSPSCTVERQAACVDDGLAREGCCSRPVEGVVYDSGNSKSTSSQPSLQRCAGRCAAEGAPFFTYGHSPPRVFSCVCKEGASLSLLQDVVSGRACIFIPLASGRGHELDVSIRTDATPRRWLDAVFNEVDGRVVRLSTEPNGASGDVTWKLQPVLDGVAVFCYVVAAGIGNPPYDRMWLSQSGAGRADIWFYDDGTGRQRWEVLDASSQDSYFVRGALTLDDQAACTDNYDLVERVGNVPICALRAEEVRIRSLLGDYLTWDSNTNDFVNAGDLNPLQSTWRVSRR